MDPAKPGPDHDDSAPSASPGAGAPRAGREYEFDESKNAVFADLALKMEVVGLFAIAVGIFVVFLGAWLFHPGSILSGALYAVIGMWTHRAGVSFKKIAQTRGHDISHLMHALNDLERLYSVQFWICVLTLAASLLATGVLLFQRWT